MLLPTPARVRGALVAATTAFQLTLQDLTNANGQPYNPPLSVLAEYAQPTRTYPSISIGYVPGAKTEWMGGNLLYIDQVAKEAVYGQLDRGGTLRITIRAHMQGERNWLFDWFDASFSSDVVADASTGQVIANAVKAMLHAYNIFPYGEPTPDIPEPDPMDERPDGMRWDTALLINCDAQLRWTVPLSAMAPTFNTISFIPQPVLQDGSVLTDPTITVPAP